ncbi:aminodeoxychorismate lyase [Lysobacter sp. KIS68-7]|uniref:aminodeoxychorismate lyase n=1 Tax=Lysobacter sp. KIS68-7 TaxID=2904252 RepID=UPI001E357975|nr:aminodeoxychorismate lyase [Lysobacter sp. KIS68-7]UHQ18408.1 aminodeoxychorismate lyase [Lysobacter sp. KIS68-7]
MTERLFAGDTRIDALPGDARGFAYGDGVFETMRVHRGVTPWWAAHRARLAMGTQRLGIPMPDANVLEREMRSLCDDGGDGVLKLIVSRGGGGRGYAPMRDAAPLWRLSRHPLPASPRAEGLALRWCDTRLSVQPALAGLKHCNRLEQILARAEWDDPAIDDGLQCSTEGEVVSATSANLFLLHGNTWTTPRIDRCGVAGVCRAWLLSQITATETRVAPADVESADAVLLCNAVRGILPVGRLGARTWAPHPAIADLRVRLGRAHPAFDQDPTGQA